ncbi:septation protein A [Photobacterium angustum]|uniref:Inner membrane-spanning protein YciB n=2 Tax=Photobacterium angustum TaxID=661 RepID=A0A2T3LYX8_PHOAN|nr:septation protein A [Photobacterium angustum]KJF82683.1 intracellular septation protein A [Photobacterium damselae subsp. damselae]EAS62776.1 putative intracellular septation protein [Vibrio angustum S14] [Photobacterium angustum S14]KJG03534.1 intracellular septation protein A [Photobacterium angustum]KJG05604.1 intracellular septation protein A [Photobacterium angustum]KJG18781.1 intracellular septation protein A [Photobacterium angustum]
MKQLIDFIPLIIFFILFKTSGIFIATGALIAATAVQVALTWFIYKKVEKMQLVTFVLVAIFGGLTIFLHDENFIKWKVTIIYAIFALALLISQFMGKPLIKSMLGKEITLPESIWLRINLAWSVFFVVCAIVNIYIAFNFPLDIWVDFKVFGLLALTLLFTFLTGGYIYRHLPKSDNNQ